MLFFFAEEWNIWFYLKKIISFKINWLTNSESLEWGFITLEGASIFVYMQRGFPFEDKKVILGLWLWSLYSGLVLWLTFLFQSICAGKQHCPLISCLFLLHTIIYIISFRTAFNFKNAFHNGTSKIICSKVFLKWLSQQHFYQN